MYNTIFGKIPLEQIGFLNHLVTKTIG